MLTADKIALVTACSAAFQVIVAWFIAVKVSNYTKKTSQLNAFMEIHKQWQEYNILAITNDKFLHSHKAMENINSYQDDGIRLKYMMFYNINIAHMLYHLSKNDGTIRETATPELDAIFGFIKNHKDIVESVLTVQRGYDREFIKIAYERLGIKKGGSSQNS